MRRYTLITAASLVVMATAVAAPPAGAKSHAKARTFSFYAQVVKSSSRGLKVRTSDGRTLSFSASQIRQLGQPAMRRPACRKHHGARKSHRCPKRHTGANARLVHGGLSSTGGSITINIQGLQPGVTILITETVDSDGNVTITITLPPRAGGQSASGVVSSVDDDAFSVGTSDGSSLRFHMAPDALAALDLHSCDAVDVSYHQDAGVLVADKVEVTGSSTSGDCTPTEDAQGTITSISNSTLTIHTDGGSLSFAVDGLDLSGFLAGDLVDVTYTTADGGSLTATDVEYVEQWTSGTATKVGSSRLTITSDEGGQSLTLLAGKGTNVQTDAFDGVHVGDHVTASYHLSGGNLVADCVQVGPPPSGDGSGGDRSGSNGENSPS